MSSYVKKLSLLAAVAVALVCAAPAQAALTVRISTDGGATFTQFVDNGTGTDPVANDGFLHGELNSGGVHYALDVTSNRPSGASFSQIEQVQIAANNSGAAIAPVALVVQVSDNGFTRPATGPATLSSSVSGTVGAGVSTGAALNVSTFQSFVDYGNNVFGGLATNPPVVPGATDTTGLQAFIVPTTTTTANFGDTRTKLTTVASTPFSLSNEFRFTGLSLAAGASIHLTGTTNLSAVPAPAGVVLALTGAPLLGLGHWLRRRKAAVKAA